MIGYCLYLVFFVSYFLRLPARVAALATIRFDLFLVVTILLYTLFRHKGQAIEKMAKGVTTKRLLILIAYIIFTLPFVQWPGSVVRFGLEAYLKVIVFYFFTVWYVDSLDKLKILVFLFVTCQAFRVIEPVLLHVTEGYWGSRTFVEQGDFMNRLSGSPHDVVNPNQLAWVIVTVFSFIYYCLWNRAKLFKLLTLALSIILTYGLLLTGSRSGLLSLLVLIVAVIILGKNRLRRLAIASFILVPLAFYAAAHLSVDQRERYRTIYDSTARGHASLAKRVEANRIILSSIWHRPIFGHGLGTSLETNATILKIKAQPTHNLYIEVLQELGIVGFVVFLVYVHGIILTLVRAKQRLRGVEGNALWLNRPIMALQAWIVMHLFYSLSCFGLSSWEWYFFGGLSATSFTLAREYSSNRTAQRCGDTSYSRFVAAS